MSTERTDVVIIVPVYKSVFDELEYISLKQLLKILGEYKICFIMPEGLDIKCTTLDKRIDIIRFSASYFKSQETYSALMLSPSFYKRFMSFRYMLIYQLDAFVFSDRLIEFCDLGFDYIGAPVARFISNWRIFNCNVGNGGFSLRKTKKCFHVCCERDRVIHDYCKGQNAEVLQKWEDVFFGFCSKIPELDFHIPDFIRALDFSVTMDVGHVFKRMPNWMPFGCHAWYTADYNKWKPIIEKFGYCLPVGSSCQVMSSRAEWRRITCARHILQKSQMCKCKEIWKKFISFYGMDNNLSYEIVIWGWGKQGKLCYMFMKEAEVGVVRVYDNKIEKDNAPCEKLIPTYEKIKCEEKIIIVASISYEDDISRQLRECGKKACKDYFLWSDIMDTIFARIKDDFSCS